MRFLHGIGNSKDIAELLKDETHLKCAVAFIGAAAPDWIYSPSANIQVICDLKSGACNPDAVSRLKERGIRVKMRAQLHAKVYLAPRRAIVSSANLSANGLGFEDDEIIGLEEAGIFIEDAGVLKSIDNWFDKLWDQAENIKKSDIDEALLLWKTRQRAKAKTLTTNQSILIEATRQPENFRNVYVVATREEWSNPAKQAILSARRENKDIDGYQEWENFPDGASLIDFSTNNTWGGAEYTGTFFSPPTERRIECPDEDGSSSWIKLVFKTHPSDSILANQVRYKLSKKEIAYLENNLREIRQLQTEQTNEDTGVYVSLYDIGTKLGKKIVREIGRKKA